MGDDSNTSGAIRTASRDEEAQAGDEAQAEAGDEAQAKAGNDGKAKGGEKREARHEEAEVEAETRDEKAETREDDDQTEQSQLALLWPCLFIFKLYISTNPRKGQSFLGEINLFYYNLCVMSCKMNF
jgi:hypothetical protein